MAKVSKFMQQILAKQAQIEQVVKSIIPDVRMAVLSVNCHDKDYLQLTVHVFVGHAIVVSIYNWDDTGDNRQKIRESYDEYLAKQ